MFRSITLNKYRPINSSHATSSTRRCLGIARLTHAFVSHGECVACPVWQYADFIYSLHYKVRTDEGHADA